MGIRATTPRAPAPRQYRARFAKLAPPRLPDALARTRLFAMLDAARQAGQGMWVASPPGSGKTTLAATWLAHVEAPFIWCQLDAADADPATLFHFLTHAARDLAGDIAWESAPLRCDAQHLAVHYFRHFYAALPDGAVVVLDNADAIDAGHAGYLLDTALTEAPEGVMVLVLSRAPVPAKVARLELDGRLRTIGADALRLTHDEARALVRDGSALALAEGWAAGVAMLARGDHGGSGEALYRYFAAEVLSRVPAASAHTLLLLACLPPLAAADAARVIADPGCALLMAQLHRQQLFVERCASAPDSYRFHPLFARFLRQVAHERIAPQCLRAMWLRAAALIEAQDRAHEAALLYQEAQAPHALAAFLLRQAPAMLATGRGESWRLWMSWLAEEHIAPLPALAYWHGRSLIDQRPHHARVILVRAERALAAAQQHLERLLAIAAIIDTYDTEWSDTSALTHWGAELARGIGETDLVALAPLADLRLHSRLAAALLSMAPASPLLVPGAERALRAMQAVDEPAELLAAGAIMLRYFDWQGSAARANALVTQLGRLAGTAAPLQLMRWHARVARWYHRDGQHVQAQQAVMAARGTGVDAGSTALQLLDIHHLLEEGELGGARELLDRCGAALAPASSPDQAEWQWLDARWHALAGDIDGALAGARQAVRIANEAGLPDWELARIDAFLGACLACQGELAQAASWCERAARAAFGVQAMLLREERDFIAAYTTLSTGASAIGVPMLRAAFESHRRRRAGFLFPMLPQLAARLAGLALEHQIEPQHVAAIVTRQRLAAPPHAPGAWPWAVAVRTLGKFSMTLHGEPVTPNGKAQQRPLALLKGLVAAGEGGKAQQALVVQLWGNADVAKSALNVNLHRLRKLLKSDGAIIVAGGRMQLDEASVWTDVGALTALCADIAAAPGDAQARAASLLDLYRGPFCDGDDEGWVLPVRDRARNMFLSAVERLGMLLEADRDWRAALTLYQRALDAEPLSESNYRGWMRCAHALDGTAAAFNAYRRCRDTLSIVLGVAPARETDRLAVELGLK